MNRIDRLFGILTLMQSRKYVSAEKIATTFGISIRTVYRDVKAIGEQGIPVSFEPGRGYFIVQGYFLPPVLFTQDEAAAMLLIENIVSAFSDKSIQTNYANALNKVRTVMPGEQKEKLEILANSTRSQYPARFKHDYEYMTVVQNAITSRHAIEVEYKNNKEELSRRRLEPIGLVFYAFAWHVIAWCHMRREYRDFKVERIVSIRNTGQPFEMKQHIDLNEYIKNLPVAY